MLTMDKCGFCGTVGDCPECRAIAILQAERDEAVALLRELTRDGFTIREEFWGAVTEARAFLARLAGGAK